MTLPTDEYIQLRLLQAAGAREATANDYTGSLKLAVLAGWTNVRIAKTLNVTEAAVRQYRKRHDF